MKRFLSFFFFISLILFSSWAHTHLVQKGETFESIAQQYGISVNALKDANPKTKQCFAGLKLVIPEKTYQSSSNSAPDDKPSLSSPSAEKTPTSISDTPSTNVVESNDIIDRLITDEKFFDEYLDFAERKLKETSTLRPREFEGKLLYTGYMTMSNLIKWLSFGQAYNGEVITEVTIKGDKLHIHNKGMHQHTMIDKDGNFILYCDVSKKGLRGDKKTLDKYFGGFETNYQNEEGVDIKVNELEKPVEYNGDICKVVQGNYSSPDGFEEDFEYWYSKNFILPDNFKYVFPGFRSPGILRKGIQNSVVKLPLVGSVKNLGAYELVAATEYPVSESEFQVPDDIIIEDFKKNSQFIKFFKENSKALKKNNLYPEKMKAKDVKLAINEKWDFAEDWTNQGDDGLSTWLKTGTSLLNGVVSVCDMINAAQRRADSYQVEERGISPNYFGGDEGEYSSVSSGQTYDGPKKSIDIYINTDRSAIEKLSKLKQNYWTQKSIQVTKERIQWLEDKKRNGITEITSEEFGSFPPAVAFDQEREEKMAGYRALHNAEMQKRRSRIKQMNENHYNHMANTLSIWNTDDYYNPEDDRSTVKGYQEEMKKIRNQYGTQKSKWEDWSGAKYTEWQ